MSPLESSYGANSSDVKLFTVHTIFPSPDATASRILFSTGVHSTTTIFPALSASKILQLEAIGKFISKEIACSVLSAFSSKYLTTKHELNPGRIL